MRKLNVQMSLLVLVLGQAGCVRYWYQEGKSFAECEQAQNECFAEIEKRTDFESPWDYEYEYLDQCMQAKGYRSVGAGELPLEVKRQNPETSLHWRRRGLAGTIEDP